MNFAKLLRTPFLQKTSGRLLLHRPNYPLHHVQHEKKSLYSPFSVNSRSSAPAFHPLLTAAFLLYLFIYLSHSTGGTAQKMKFSIKDLVTFTEEILNGELHFLSSDTGFLFHITGPPNQF